MDSFPEMYNDPFFVISGPEKSPLQISRPSRFSAGKVIFPTHLPNG